MIYFILENICETVSATKSQLHMLTKCLYNLPNTNQYFNDNLLKIVYKNKIIVSIILFFSLDYLL